jgi:hypothetical protein
MMNFDLKQLQSSMRIPSLIIPVTRFALCWSMRIGWPLIETAFEASTMQPK